MNPITITEAAQKLPDLIDAAIRGEEVSITKDGSVVKLIPANPVKPRQPGSAKGQVWMSDDFERGSVLNSFQHTQVSLDEPLEEFKEYME